MEMQSAWILLGVVAVAVIVILLNRSRRERELEKPSPPPTGDPLTPEEIEERRRMGEQWEQWKRDNNVSGP